jgi:hypothetical protein
MGCLEGIGVSILYIGQGMQLLLCFNNTVLKTAVIRSEVVIQGTIFDKFSQIMADTADVVIMGRILQDVELTNKMQFEINDLKTNFMIVSQMPCNECEYTDTVFFFWILSIICQMYITLQHYVLEAGSASVAWCQRVKRKVVTFLTVINKEVD